MPAAPASTPARSGALSLPALSWLSLWRRKLRLLNSLLALTTASLLVAALSGIYRGVQRDIRRQFRIYGPNLVATPSPGEKISVAQIAAAHRALGPSVRLAGVLYTVGSVAGRAGHLHSVVIAGAHLPALRRINSYWKLRGRLPRSSQVWLGQHTARVLHAGIGAPVRVSYGASHAYWRVAGIIISGGSADSQIFAPLSSVRRLSGIPGYTTLIVQAPATPAGIRRARRLLRQTLPRVGVHTIRQIAVNEGLILLRTRGMLFASILFILLTLALCVAAALAGQALERRREIGIFKALGGENREILLVFLYEHLWLGLTGGLLGFLLGSLLACAIAEAVFHVALWPGAVTLLFSLAASLGLSALAAIVPFGAIVRTHPAGILRGE